MFLNKKPLEISRGFFISFLEVSIFLVLIYTTLMLVFFRSILTYKL